MSTIEIAGLEGGRVKLASEQLDDLDSRVEGPLLRPGDQGWDGAVLVWNGMVAKVPALVLQPVSAQDVAAAWGSHVTTGCCSAPRVGATTSLEPLSARAA